MQFRPCIDIHNGAVKQIIGGTLNDEKLNAAENFVSESSAAYFAGIYKDRGLSGGHIINLNSADSPMYQKSLDQAKGALQAYRGGMQYGGGVNDRNAVEMLDAGASHVIVTSYVFKDGELNYVNLDKLVKTVGKERLVLDLSCRKRDGKYYVVTDRWQKFTDIEVDIKLFNELSSSCDEFLVHGVDVEGKRAGIDEELVRLLAKVDKVVTYAGGVRSAGDMDLIKRLGEGRVNVTVGSALKIFGGTISLEELTRRL